jgi:hypothetical protein
MSGFFGSLAGTIGSITGALKWTGSAIAQAATADLSDVTAPTNWIPTDQSGAGLTFSGVSCVYCKIGNLIFAYGTLTYPSTASSATAAFSLPVAVPNQNYASLNGTNATGLGVNGVVVQAIKNTSTAQFLESNGVTYEENSALSAKTITFVLIYPAS